MTKADNQPSPAEILKQELEADEADLKKLQEQLASGAEEVEEDSLPSDTEEPTEEPATPEEEETVEEQESDTVEETKDETDEIDGVSNRAKERFKKISSERREALQELSKLREEKENLVKTIEALQVQGYTKQDAEAIAPHIETGQVDPQRLQQEISRQAQAIVNQTLTQRELEQARIQSAERFQEDLKTIEKEHEVLNEDSPEYDEKLSYFVAELYDSRSKANPKVRLTDIANEVMALRQSAAEEATKKQVGKIAKQASKQAMSPSGGKVDTTTLMDKIQQVDSESELEELRKQIGITD